MIKSYIVVIYDKNKKVKSQKFCNDMEECENYLYNYSGKEKIADFEIFKEIDNSEVMELLKLCMKRFIDNV